MLDVSGPQTVNGPFAFVLKEGDPLSPPTALSSGGDDTLESGPGDDTLDGGAGNDTVTYQNAASGVTVSLAISGPQDTIGAGHDTLISIENLTGSAFGDSLTGDGGANILVGGNGNDTLVGGAGDDILRPGLGDDFVDGGAGVNIVSYSDLSGGVGVTVRLGSGSQDTIGAGVDTFASIRGVIGSQYNDILVGSAVTYLLSGGGGDDLIDPGARLNSSLDGGAGIDTLTCANAELGQDIDLSYAGTTGFENAIGSAFNDTLHGDAGANVLSGLAGDDIFFSSAGNDTYIGGDGRDLVRFYGFETAGVTIDLNLTTAQVGGATAGSDTLVGIEDLIGTQYNDVLTGDAGDNVITGGGGVDHLDGGAGVDTASFAFNGLGAGVYASLSGYARDGGILQPTDTTLLNFENLIGTPYIDNLVGDAGNNRLEGGLNDDTLFGEAGDDTLLGQDGSDYLLGGLGNDLLDGGADRDTADYSEASAIPGTSQGVTVNLSLTGPQDTGAAGIDTLSSIEILIGSAFADTLTGGEGADTIYGGAGDDIIEGGHGGVSVTYDLLDGGAGIDTASYAGTDNPVTVNLSAVGVQYTLGAGRDYLLNFENVQGSAFGDSLTGDTGNNTLWGGGGDDWLVGGDGDDILIGGAGRDRASYLAATGVTVSLARTDAQFIGAGQGSDTLSGIEDLMGSQLNDVLTGDSGSNDIVGLNGNDVIEGGGGSDTLDGGAGFDTASYVGAAAAVTVSLAVTGAQDTLGAGVDTLTGFENLLGSAFDDILSGNGDNNVLDGRLGSDTLFGGDGADILYDGGETTNRDFLYGGAGNDTYYVTSSVSGPADLVYEGTAVAGAQGGAGDVDVIHSGGEFFRDFYNVGEQLYIDTAAGSQLVGGTNSQSFFGNSGADVMLVYGGSNRIDAGAGTDVIGLNLYGLDESFDGVNTVVMKAGSGIDYVYDFESGVDKIDLTAFHFGITGQQVLDQAVNVDNPGTANDYSYFYLTNAGGVDNYIVFMGLLSNQLHASDFIT